jgi:plasmid stability protein
MPVNLSIKDVPDDVAEKLKQRARRNHRSLQGELRAIVEQAASAASANEKLTIGEALAHMRALGVRTKDQAVRLIREDRDSR